MSGVEYFYPQMSFVDNCSDIDASNWIDIGFSSIGVLLFQLMAESFRVIIVNQVIRTGRV